MFHDSPLGLPFIESIQRILLSMKATRKYLRRNAEAAVEGLQYWPANASYDHVVVIPAYDEKPDFFHRLMSNQLSQNNALAIIVVNRPDNASTCPHNLRLIATIQQLLPLIWQPETITHDHFELRGSDSSAVLLVNRESNPIPYRQGVGLARKIGADLAAALITAGKIASPWIHSTDADAHLPIDYFSCVEELTKECSAACYQFEHIDDGTDIGTATQWYQSTLYHYRDGLAQAGSPYAYFTIGSTLVFHHHAYCQAHGFPKRAGGEDFYLLNKLAKLGTVETLSSVIELESRPSHRVPFGTGPASSKILQRLNDNQPLLSYDRAIFIELRKWITLATDTIGKSKANLDPLNLTGLHSVSQQALHSLGINNCWQHLNQSSDAQWRLRHFHNWFDAFRTLKFVHYLQENSFPAQPLKTKAVFTVSGVESC